MVGPTPQRSGRKLLPPRAPRPARHRKRPVFQAKVFGRDRKQRRSRPGHGAGWSWEGGGLSPRPERPVATCNLGDLGLRHRGPRPLGGRRESPGPSWGAKGGGRGVAAAAAGAGLEAPCGARGPSLPGRRRCRRPDGGPRGPGLPVPHRAPAPGAEPAVDPSESRPLPPQREWSRVPEGQPRLDCFQSWSLHDFSPGAVPGRCGWLPPEVWAAGEQELLLLLEPEEFLQGVATLTQISGPTRWVPWITPEITARPHLAVIGLDAYLWSRQHVPRGTQPESLQVAGVELAVGWPEVEEALVLLQLWANLDVLLVASWEELSQHVCAITKALAQCPLKQYRESQAFSFCTVGRWAAGEPVARDGTGLRGAWWRQIRQFSRVSPAVADAVVTAFPSPRLLQQAFMACSTERERLRLLADLPVMASEDGRSRRVGPDLSRRICLFLTTANPDLLLDLSS
ncbi:probable crossover junction endonuclease EME2 isoform X1 [Cebus imitator]|uniref:probable crossover junction endonuclease EME2 isoform X1 n=1 Tax=Cebus imitator TaxID=2715852 RepID=UPI000809B53F|nr:probable crossover junction endonuclease EME2 isoform X1 [Cebus imitator]